LQLSDCKPRSVKTYLVHVGNLLHWAARNELIEREFDVRVHPAKLSTGKSADPFELWEFQKLLEVTPNKQFRNMLLVLARPGELRALSWGMSIWHSACSTSDAISLNRRCNSNCRRPIAHE
jgi:integrase